MRDVCVHLKTGTCTGSLIDDDDGGREDREGLLLKLIILLI